MPPAGIEAVDRVPSPARDATSRRRDRAGQLQQRGRDQPGGRVEILPPRRILRAHPGPGRKIRRLSNSIYFWILTAPAISDSSSRGAAAGTEYRMGQPAPLAGRPAMV